MRRTEKRRHGIQCENQQKDGDIGGLNPVWVKILLESGLKEETTRREEEVGGKQEASRLCIWELQTTVQV